MESEMIQEKEKIEETPAEVEKEQMVSDDHKDDKEQKVDGEFIEEKEYIEPIAEKN